MKQKNNLSRVGLKTIDGAKKFRCAIKYQTYLISVLSIVPQRDNGGYRYFCLAVR